MKRALILSLVLHLAVLTGAVVWFQGSESGHRRQAVALRTLSRPPAPVGPAASLPRLEAPALHPSRPQVLAPDSDLPTATGDPEGEPLLEPATAAEALSGVVSGEGNGAVPDRPASLVTFEQPVYPREARRRGWEGVVTVEVLVDAAGRWASASVAQSSGREVLDRAALGALRSAVFRPALHDGQTEAGTVTARVRFQLR